eukprot:COSAG02_NODE_5644_length_4157_cov_2.247166_3_plen_77_part_00
MWRRYLRRHSSGLRSQQRPVEAASRRAQQHIACRGTASTMADEAAPTVDGWTVNGWVESQAVPYNTVSGWDPDHCE